jgi:hypothetical protein
MSTRPPVIPGAWPGPPPQDEPERFDIVAESSRAASLRDALEKAAERGDVGAAQALSMELQASTARMQAHQQQLITRRRWTPCGRTVAYCWEGTRPPESRCVRKVATLCSDAEANCRQDSSQASKARRRKSSKRFAEGRECTARATWRRWWKGDNTDGDNRVTDDRRRDSDAAWRVRSEMRFEHFWLAGGGFQHRTARPSALFAARRLEQLGARQQHRDRPSSNSF